MPARRTRRKSPSFAPLFVLVAIAALGWAGWRYGPALLDRLAAGSGTTAPATTDVCALVPVGGVAAALGVARVEMRRVGAGAGVPAAGACTWDFERDGAAGSAVAMLFTPASLSRGGVATTATAYYDSAVTGLEYAYKEIPAKVDGIGDAAAAAGFGGGAEPPQLIVRSGDRVLVLVLRNADLGAAERLARALAARLRA